MTKHTHETQVPLLIKNGERGVRLFRLIVESSYGYLRRFHSDRTDLNRVGCSKPMKALVYLELALR